MSATLYNGDGRTHFKIIVVGLLGALVVVWVSAAAHLGTDKILQLQSDAPIAIASTPSTDRTIRR